MTSKAAVPTTTAFHIQAERGETYMLHGARCTLKVTGADTGGAYTVMEAVQPPGYLAPYHVHKREHEAVFVLEGELEVCIRGEVVRLPPGAFLHAPPGVPHSLANTTETNNRFLCLFTPAGFETFLRAAGEPAAADEAVTGPQRPKDMEAFLALTRAAGMDPVPLESGSP